VSLAVRLVAGIPGEFFTVFKLSVVSTLLTLAVCGVLWQMPLSAQELTEDRFLELHAELQPDNTALWRTIPWKTSVLDAQQAAAEEKKPLFIWAMDGHPLGCT